MQGGGDDGDRVRRAAESLRALHDELPALAEGLDRSIRKLVENTVEPLEQADLVKEAHGVRLTGTEMTAAREDAFASIAHVLPGYADEIEALLRPADGHGSGSAPVISIPPPPAPAVSVVTTAQDTATVQQNLPDADAHRRAINQVVARFPPKLQELARKLLFGHSAHAVQRHGHHLRREQQIARTQWQLDPAGVDGWRLNSDGSAESWRGHGDGPHGVGATSGHYASPEAVAKPLAALLGAAGRTQAELDAHLNRLTGGKTIARVFLRPSDAGISSDDVVMVRGPGTDTEDGDALWKSTRDGSMAGLGAPPAVRDYDMVTRGKRPGSLMILVRRPNQSWRLVTSYFFDDRDNLLDYVEL
ncbi:hypothetical protein [Jiangella mangrovi]|uniref:Uncharacterized protein n=1 Tax=Jiangella mangrovi TaxID=1524084 RepID=A0A7W9LN47_9ACTN|nr:hypothetical protein [Jiangella mangrovi]MBB5789910.1 hypothetical protein [Jiangella mangrovi]